MTEPQFTAEHEWVVVDDATGVATVGITPYAAAQLGDVVYLDLPAVGSTVEPGRVVGEIESTKSVGELYAPVAGEIVDVNQDAVDDPSLVNADPLATWLIRIRFTEPPTLLSADEYAALTNG